jgi:WD40 repeat protein
VAWSPDSKYVASGGLDCAIIIWSVSSPEKHTITTSAHAQSQITAITWIDNKTVASAGQDGNIKLWSVDIK